MTTQLADDDTPISSQRIDGWGMRFWESTSSRPYRDLSHDEQIWLWDFARTFHQRMGKKVDTRATWLREVPPMERKVTTEDLIKLLDAAKLELSPQQPAITRAIMSCIEFVRRIHAEEAMKDYEDFVRSTA